MDGWMGGWMDEQMEELNLAALRKSEGKHVDMSTSGSRMAAVAGLKKKIYSLVIFCSGK